MVNYFTAAANTINASNVNVSADDIWGSRIYRTTTAGSEYFQWIDHNGNLGNTTISDDSTDESLSTFPMPGLGSAPNLSHIAEWRSRLWGVVKGSPDTVAYTEAGIPYAWPYANRIAVPPKGINLTGVRALIPRREALGMARGDSFHQVTGTSNNDFRVVKLSNNTGCVSQESVVIYRDIAYFLWYDGVY